MDFLFNLFVLFLIFTCFFISFCPRFLTINNYFMKTIIRVEASDGYGMFRSTNKEGEDRLNVPAYMIDSLGIRHNRFNTPDEDGLNMTGEWFCAYKSMEQFTDWVTADEVKQIIGFGYKVLILDVLNYQEGEHQIIFTKDSIVSYKDVSSLFV